MTRKAHVIERCDGLGSVVAPYATSKQCRRGMGCGGALLVGGGRCVRRGATASWAADDGAVLAAVFGDEAGCAESAALWDEAGCA